MEDRCLPSGIMESATFIRGFWVTEGFLGGLVVKNLPAMQKTWVQALGQEDPLEKGMAAHSSILAWRILWTEEPGRLSPWGRKESDTTEQLTLTLGHRTSVLNGVKMLFYPTSSLDRWGNRSRKEKCFAQCHSGRGPPRSKVHI